MRHSVILNTDAGYDPDDDFAIALALKMPKVKPSLVLTSDEVKVSKRAKFARRLLEEAGHYVPIATGLDLGNDDYVFDDIESKETFLSFPDAAREIIGSSDKVTYIGIGTFTELAHLLIGLSESERKKLEVFQMGGAIDFSRRPGWVEHNVRTDVKSARYVINSGIDLHLVMAQTTNNPVYEVNYNSSIHRMLAESTERLHHTILRHYNLWNAAKGFGSFMHDPLTVAAAAREPFVKFYESGIKMDEKGVMSLSSEGPMIKISYKESKDEQFMRFLEHKLFS